MGQDSSPLCSDNYLFSAHSEILAPALKKIGSPKNKCVVVQEYRHKTEDNFIFGATQMIRDTLGEWKCSRQCHQITHGRGRWSNKVSHTKSLNSITKCHLMGSNLKKKLLISWIVEFTKWFSLYAVWLGCRVPLVAVAVTGDHGGPVCPMLLLAQDDDNASACCSWCCSCCCWGSGQWVAGRVTHCCKIK